MDRIKKAYKSSKDIYDSVLTQKNPFSRLYIKLFWNGTDDTKIAQELLSRIPDNFSGTILDVPVGTAVFTSEKWQKLSRGKIICLDYSKEMIEKARSRLKDFPHISFVQGDVGNLPLQNENCDIVFSMNGFHAFPDKEKAFEETFRVLKDGGKFIGCFYIKGELKNADWLVKNILSKKGWFSPPFLAKNELEQLLARMYRKTEIYADGAIAYFECEK